MKLTFVVQRYGPEIRGGAEAHCREFATRLANRGCDVEVFTTCATDYRTWRNVLPPGQSTDDGVRVNRFPVIRERDEARFDELSHEVLARPGETPRALQEQWMTLQGPDVPELVEALRTQVSTSDLVIFVTYLYYTSFHGLQVAACRSVLHPTVHDEPPVHLSMFDDMFALPKAFVFYSEEEQAFVRRRFDIGSTPEIVSGIGIDGPADVDATRVARRLGVSGRYVLYLGRIDQAKGVDQLCSYFATYRTRRDDPVELVLAGDPVAELPDGPGISVVGRLSDQEKWDAMAGAEALVHPSRYESFAANLLESWCVETPAIVNAACSVTVGHCRRADGGVWYRSYAEFEACMDRLLADGELRAALGRQGRQYVEAHYGWGDVIDRYLSFLRSVRDRLPELDRSS